MAGSWRRRERRLSGFEREGEHGGAESGRVECATPMSDLEHVQQGRGDPRRLDGTRGDGRE